MLVIPMAKRWFIRCWAKSVAGMAIIMMPWDTLSVRLPVSVACPAVKDFHGHCEIAVLFTKHWEIMPRHWQIMKMLSAFSIHLDRASGKPGFILTRVWYIRIKENWTLPSAP